MPEDISRAVLVRCQIGSADGIVADTPILHWHRIRRYSRDFYRLRARGHIKHWSQLIAVNLEGISFVFWHHAPSENFGIEHAQLVVPPSCHPVRRTEPTAMADVAYLHNLWRN